MTEEQVKVLFGLFNYRDTLLDGLRQQHSPQGLRVRSHSSDDHWRHDGFTIHICTEEQGAELLELITKWNREALKAVEQQITDMGVPCPQKRRFNHA